MPIGVRNPGNPGYRRLYSAGVTRDQVVNAIKSGLNPLQMPPEYYGLRGGFTPDSVGPGANPVQEWGVDIPSGASGPGSGEIPSGLPYQGYTPYTDFPAPFSGPNYGPLGDVTSGTPPGSLSDVTPGSGPEVSAGSPFEGARAGTVDNPFEGATASGSIGNGPFEGATAGSYNYYDAGNGVTYVYDENWNYIGTNNTGPSSTPVQGQPMGQPPAASVSSGQGDNTRGIAGVRPSLVKTTFGTVGTSPYAQGSVAQGPDAVYGQTYSANSAAGAFSMQMALEGLGGGGPSINAKYQ